MQTFPFKKIHLKLSSGKWRPFCVVLNVLNWKAASLNCRWSRGMDEHKFSHIIHGSCNGAPTPAKSPDDIIKWKHFPCYWLLVPGIQRPPVNSPHKGQGRGALMFSLICAWINGWVNNREAGDLTRHHAHYVVSVMNEIVSPWISMPATQQTMTQGVFPGRISFNDVMTVKDQDWLTYIYMRRTDINHHIRPLKHICIHGSKT